MSIITDWNFKSAVFLVFMFIALNVIDILLTWQGLRFGAMELNFFMRDVMALGFIPSICFKVGVASGIAAVMLYRQRLATMVIGVIMLIAVCCWNLNTISNLV